MISGDADPDLWIRICLIKVGSRSIWRIPGSRIQIRIIIHPDLHQRWKCFCLFIWGLHKSNLMSKKWSKILWHCSFKALQSGFTSLNTCIVRCCTGNQFAEPVPVPTFLPESVKNSVVDPNSLKLDRDPAFWSNLDPDPDPWLQVCYPFWIKCLKKLQRTKFNLFSFPLSF